jgi:undecaprenyl-diphosphatase
LFLGTLPILFFGGLYTILDLKFDSPVYLLFFLILGSLLMTISEYVFLKQKHLRDRIFRPKEAFVIGLFQSLSILSGFSRSGSTISGSLLLGHNREKSVRFSFLMSIPAITIAGAISVLNILIFDFNRLSFLPNKNFNLNNLSVLGLIFGIVSSYITGYMCLKWLLKYLSKNTFLPFIIYRLVLILILSGIMIGL